MTKTRNLTDVAYGVAAYFEGEERAGRLSRADAQGAAIRALKNLRYDSQEYSWVNDLQPRMVAHPVKPELEGKDLSAVQDPTGKRLFVDFVETVKPQGQGFVDYYSPKPGADAPVPKLSCVRGFAPWGWVIGTGIDADDTAAILRNAAWRAAGGMLVVVALIGLLAALIGRRLTLPLLALNRSMHRLAAGETAVPAAARERTDEIGAMAGAVQVFKDALIAKAETDARAVSSVEGGARRAPPSTG